MLKAETAVRQSRLAEFMKALSRHAILIIDEIGYLPLSRDQAHLSSRSSPRVTSAARPS